MTKRTLLPVIAFMMVAALPTWNVRAEDARCQFKCLPNGQYYVTAKECRANCKIGLGNPGAQNSCMIRTCDLKAEHGPYQPVVRAGVVTLDGSRSTGPKGQDLTYEWTFKTVSATDSKHPSDCPDGSSGNSNAKKTGKQVKVTLLCTTEITLVVHRGNQSSAPDRQTVMVKKRDWKTDFRTANEEVSGKPPFVPLFTPAYTRQLGKNSCTCAIDTGHVIHRNDDGIWEGDVYQMKQIEDPGGPFDGFWYISSKNMKIERRSIINKDLVPGSTTYDINKREGRETDFALLLMETRAHESTHTILLEEKFRENGFDPAPKIEKRFKKDRDQLKEDADYVLRDAESDLLEATSETNVRSRLSKDGRFTRKGKVLLRVAQTRNYSTWFIENYADLGD